VKIGESFANGGFRVNEIYVTDPAGRAIDFACRGDATVTRAAVRPLVRRKATAMIGFISPPLLSHQPAF
jgi:hypothetical protein